MNDSDNAMTRKGIGLNRLLLLLMSSASGLTVANLYYAQPLLEELSRYYSVLPGTMGISAMLIQIGYALGLFFLVPLGDIREHRKLIITVLFGSMITLLGLSYAPNMTCFLAGSLLVGVTSIVPMLVLSFAAHLARPTARGQVIGIVMSGLLIGILLSRTFSGIVGSVLGWQAVYRIASVMMGLLILIFSLCLPRSNQESIMTYGALLKSLGVLLKNTPVLQESAIIGAMMFATFSTFWTSLSFLLKSPAYHLGAQAAGLFGLIGIVGALAASIVGRLADKKGPCFTLKIAIALSGLSYLFFWFFGYRMAGLVTGVILLDMGIQSGQVSNQARINALTPEARNRINAVYMVCYFCGGALGSALGSIGWEYFGWSGVCAVGMVFQIIAATVCLSGKNTLEGVSKPSTGT